MASGPNATPVSTEKDQSGPVDKVKKKKKAMIAVDSEEVEEKKGDEVDQVGPEQVKTKVVIATATLEQAKDKKGGENDEIPPMKQEEEEEASMIFESDDEDDESPVCVRLPIVSLSHGLRRKASAFQLKSWVSLALTLDGRDKITKVLQYTSRFLAWWLAGLASHQAERFAAMKVSLTNCRKAFRLGRSLIEYHNLRSLGLLELIRWHLRQHVEEGGDEGAETEAKPPPQRPKILLRSASSNIGWGPVTIEEESAATRRRPSFYRSLSRSMSNVAYRMYRPLASRLVSFGDTSASSIRPKDDTPILMLVGAALKMLGLAGFWTGDNLNFLTASGLFDNYQDDKATRMAKRKELQVRASKFANRCYFVGAVAGLLVSLRAYWSFRQNQMRKLKHEIETAEDEDEAEHAYEELDKAKEKQFLLSVALLKSCCDVLVFSNNPGIDLWKKYKGRKMHEGFHCLCGLLSASTVLYKNFPSSNK